MARSTDDTTGLEEKTAIITGGSGALGQAMTQLFLAKGVNVVNADPSRSLNGESPADPDRYRHIPVDVTDRSAVEKMVSQAIDAFGSIDILVNNAGGQVRPMRFLDMSADMFDWEIKLNIYGTLHCTQAVGKHMVDRGRGGSIINISSNAALKAAAGQHAACYGGCKGFVLSLAKVLAYDFSEYDIRVNTVAPGWIVPESDAEISEDSFWNRFGFDMFGGPDKFNEEFNRTGALHSVPDQPLKRLGRPRDVAEAVAYFASSHSAHITGQLLSVSGGDYMPS